MKASLASSNQRASCDSLQNMEVAADPFATADADWNPPRYGWLSPRISFSQDFSMLERVSSEKRKRDHVSEEDEYSSEFEFSMTNESLDLLPTAAMLSADELFLNGKLRPLHLLPRIGCEEVYPWASRDKIKLEDEKPWPMARHLSFEKSRCSSMSLEIDRGNVRRSSISLENSRCSSPSRSFSLPTTTPPSPKVSKHSSRFKDFFKIGKLHVHPAEVSREHAASSNRRRPIYPRSFWPFSRSNSAGESKTTAPLPVLPRRSNSAGESKTTSSCLLPFKNSTDGGSRRSSSKTTTTCPSAAPPKLHGKLSHTSCTSYRKMNESSCSPENLSGEITASDPNGAAFVSEPHPTLRSGVCSSMLSVATAVTPLEKDSTSPRRIEATKIANCATHETVKHSDHASNLGLELRDAKEDLNSTDQFSAARVKGSGSPGRIHRSVVSPVRNFGRGIHGRRGVCNSPGRGNAVAGKPVLSNLERWNVNSKVHLRSQDLRASEWQTSYSASMRVTPVLNVPTCIGPSLRVGKASKNRLFNLRSFFFKKEKLSEVSSMTSPINDWRNGG